MTDFWNDRYESEEYGYGTAPNDFLKQVIEKRKIFSGSALCLADGEGRNGVFLATCGCDVTSVDFSSVGLEKALKLAERHQVSIETTCANLSQYCLGADRWDLIVSIFAHFPETTRRHVHDQIARALKPGGIVILEAYRPENVGRGVGGPPTPETAFTRDMLTDDFTGLEFIEINEVERDISEGIYHNGRSAVIQIVARRP